MNIAGILTANKGSNIAGWTTDDSKIYKDGTGMMSSGVYAFYAGADIGTTNNPKFSVSHEGKLTATSGEIGGWTIDTSKLYNGYTGMSTTDKYVFYAGSSNDYNFSVTQSGSLFARDALIDNSLIVKKGNYKISIDGSSIDMIYGSNSSRSSFISFASSGNGVSGGGNNANLALAGYEKILFGIRPNGSWNPICELGMSDTLVTNSKVLYLRPAKTSYFEEAYLGTSDQPWTSLYMKSTALKTTIKLEPVLITYQTGEVLGVPIINSRYFLAASILN